MFSFGIYKNKLYKTLIPFGIFTTLLLAGLSGHFLMRQQKSSYLQYLSNLVTASETNSNVAINLISRAVNDTFRNETILDWSRSGSIQELNFNSITALKQLRLITTDSSLVYYEMAVTALKPESHTGLAIDTVLERTGTVSQNDFYYKKKGLTPEQRRDMEHHFAVSASPFVIPHYVDSTLDSIYYIVRDTRNGSGLLCFITIPASVFAGQTATDNYMLYSQGRLLAGSRETPDSSFFQQLVELAKAGARQEKGFYKLQNDYIFTISLPAFGWEMAYVYEIFLPSGGQILFFLFILAGAACIFLMIAALLVEALYRPIKDVIRDAVTEARDGKPIDEFKIIRQNSDKIKSLSKSLMEALEENGQMASQQQYRRLLFTPQPSAALKNSAAKESRAGETEEWYSVAVIDFQLAEEKSLPGHPAILKQYVQEFAMSENTMSDNGMSDNAMSDNAMSDNKYIYVDLDFTQCAVVMKSGKTDELYKRLSRMVYQLSQKPENAGQWVALSSPKKGQNNIWQAYQECQRILEYKHLYHHSSILTYEQIESVDMVTYSYPLSTENRLVHCILEGKEESLSIFDQLIRTNLVDKTLSIESIQSFVYALIGTVGRIFQELKTSPEALLSEEVPFKYLYEHWNDSVTITTLRHTLSHILEAVACREANDHKQMLDGMLQFIHNNYMDDIMLNDMADFMNISPKYCGILFKQLSEQNFKDYLNRFRVERAKEMLVQNPGLKISDLSLMVGFNSANSFIRVFGKYTGVTPKAYVEKLRG